MDPSPKSQQLTAAEIGQRLRRHWVDWKACTKCGLCLNATNHVLYRRSSYEPTQVLFLGEAPGFSEDATGKPFSGPAGDELTELINLVSGDIGPFTWVKTNPVACIPIDDRDPEKTRHPSAVEIAECMIRVVELVRILRPKLIVLCGSVAEKAWKSIGAVKWNRAYGKGPWDDVTSLLTVKIAHPTYIAFKADDPVYEQKKARLTLRSAIMRMRSDEN